MSAAPDIDREKLDATTDEDIRNYKASEGFARDYRPDGPVLSVPAVSELRERLRMTQDAFARFLRIPVATIRNWEQGRKIPDPAARTLLALVAADPRRALVLLGDEKATSVHPKIMHVGEIHVETTKEVVFSSDPSLGYTSIQRLQLFAHVNRRAN
ncbi:helix-turn-helix domain-containing protein [Methylobacterium sp. DB1607]|nr:helix-turn-helix domain-containing protein [Methylobacterium sp. DB1607]